MKVHELKTWPEFFEPIVRFEKTFELRKDCDRGFRAGDVLHLREWSKRDGYTGREVAKKVTYLLGGWGLERDHVCMALGHTDWTPNANSTT